MMSNTKRFFIFAFFLSACKAEPEPTPSVRYPEPWREEFNVGITKTLAAKHIKGCGQYKYRESSKDKGEYLVHCTSDGKNWTAYLVWPNINEVTGPHAPDVNSK